MTARDHPVLDLERLSLITRRDAALAYEYLDALASEANELLAPVRSPDIIAGPERVASAAHTLKGIACEVGASRLAFLAAEFESDPQEDHRTAHLAAIDAALRDLRAAALGTLRRGG
jgi:HPt (histidine-containing phosphotransfer) domain-containing protein